MTLMPGLMATCPLHGPFPTGLTSVEAESEGTDMSQVEVGTLCPWCGRESPIFEHPGLIRDEIVTLLTDGRITRRSIKKASKILEDALSDMEKGRDDSEVAAILHRRLAATAPEVWALIARAINSETSRSLAQWIATIAAVLTLVFIMTNDGNSLSEEDVERIVDEKLSEHVPSETESAVPALGHYSSNEDESVPAPRQDTDQRDPHGHAEDAAKDDETGTGHQG